MDFNFSLITEALDCHASQLNRVKPMWKTHEHLLYSLRCILKVSKFR